MCIFSDTESGKLEQSSLDACRALDPSFSIDAPGPKGLTLLATACLNGQTRLVRALLSHPNKASPNALSSHSRSPVFFAAVGEDVHRGTRQQIFEVLIAKGADLNAPSDTGRTPLMELICRSKTPELISLLVNSGADVELENNRGESARKLANNGKKPEVINALLPLQERSKPRRDLVTRVVDHLLFVVMWVNGVYHAAKEGLLQKVFGISGRESPEMVEAIQKDDDVKKMQQNIDDFLADSKLDDFFPKNDPFLRTVLEKAVQMKENPNTSLRSDENIQDLTKLALYQTVIFCDDSGSMKRDNRIGAQKELVKRIARVATHIVPDDEGVAVSFINSHIFEPRLREDGVGEVMASLGVPKGTTQLGIMLRKKVLQPMVYDMIENNERLRRPVLISVITDGAPGGGRERGDTFMNTLIECKDKLVAAGYAPATVRFQISQIGNDKDSKVFLDQLRAEERLKDVLFCTTDRLDEGLETMKENEDDLEQWLLKTLMGPILLNGA